MAVDLSDPLALFYRAANPMLIVDDSRRYIAVNDAACNFLKRDRREIVGATIDSLTPEGNIDGIDGIWQLFLQSGSLCGKYDLVDGRGTTVTVQFNSSANILPGRHLTIFFMDDQTDEKEITPLASSNLSPREVQIISLLANGNRGVEIADLLALSPDTVRVHVRNAMRKLGARTRAQAVARALGRDLISLDED